MTCRDFQRHWDDLLDADARVPATSSETHSASSPLNVIPAAEDGEEALLVHAAECPDCQQLGARYRVLRHATRAWRCPPVPSADLADRILAAAEAPPFKAWPVDGDEGRERIRSTYLSVASIVAAAAILVAVVLPRISMMIRSRDGRPATQPTITSRGPDQDLHAISGPIPTPGDQTRT